MKLIVDSHSYFLDKNVLDQIKGLTKVKEKNIYGDKKKKKKKKKKR